MRIGQPEWQWALATVSAKEIADALVTGDADLGASGISSLVWVPCLSGLVSARLILNGTNHASTLATVAGGGGVVNELLLREAHQVGRGELPSSLIAVSGGECPAKFTLALIFHKLKDGTSSDPIDLC